MRILMAFSKGLLVLYLNRGGNGILGWMGEINYHARMDDYGIGMNEYICGTGFGYEGGVMNVAAWWRQGIP